LGSNGSLLQAFAATWCCPSSICLGACIGLCLLLESIIQKYLIYFIKIKTSKGAYAGTNGSSPVSKMQSSLLNQSKISQKY
jgi:hypothetical protein